MGGGNDSSTSSSDTESSFEEIEPMHDASSSVVLNNKQPPKKIQSSSSEDLTLEITTDTFVEGAGAKKKEEKIESCEMPISSTSSLIPVPPPFPATKSCLRSSSSSSSYYSPEKELHGVVRVAAPLNSNEKRSNVDVTLVIDKSSSMKGEKFSILKNTIEYIIKNLRENDRLALVVYDEAVSVAFPLTAMNEAGKEKSLRVVKQLETGTSTNLSGGMIQGLSIMKNRDFKNSVSSVLLMTDGLANVGLRKDEQLLAALGGALRDLEVTFYTFGFGSDHNAPLLKSMSDVGKGMYYFIESAEQVAEAFADCFGGLLHIVAQNISLQLWSPTCPITHVHTTKQVSFSADRKRLELSLGDLQYEESRNLLFRFNLPKTSSSDSCHELHAKLSYFDLNGCCFKEVETTHAIPVTSHLFEKNERVRIVSSRDILKQRKRIICSEGMSEALEQSRRGNLPQAQRLLSDTIRSLESMTLDELDSKDRQAEDADFTRGLIQDLTDCLAGIKTTEAFKAKGSHTLCMMSQGHHSERTNTLSAPSKPMESLSYTTPSKVRFKKAFFK